MNNADYGRWWMWDGDAWMERNTDDHKRVLPIASRLPASYPVGGQLRVLRKENGLLMEIEVNMPDRPRDTSLRYVLLDRPRAGVLRDWITAFLRTKP